MPRIAVFAGADATILNTEPLVTSNKARRARGLPERLGADGRPLRFDVLRPQRLAAPATVYVERFSAHPLEADAAGLYGPPDGYLAPDGSFHREPAGPEAVPVHEIRLEPGDGLYPLPYMDVQADGRPWDGDEAEPFGPPDRARQPFFPDASRLFEEIDRLHPGEDGLASHLSRLAEYDFFRAAPPGGYTAGLAAARRTDVGDGDIAPEVRGRDFFAYRPPHLLRQPSRTLLARVTRTVASALAGTTADGGAYDGALWLEGSPIVEETAYWLGLVIDTDRPIAACASQRPHGAVGNDGDRNVIDAVEYLVSHAWADDDDRDVIGPVVVMDQQLFTARSVQKGDARPGGYRATGGDGGIVGTISRRSVVRLPWRPTHRQTWRSAVRLSELPDEVGGVAGGSGAPIERVGVRTRESDGSLVADALPVVTIAKFGHYGDPEIDPDAADEPGILAQVERSLAHHPLAGFVAEGTAPYGSMGGSAEAALRIATLSGMPVVKVGRGNADGYVDRTYAPFAIAGSNLTATKARLLLIACLLRFGALPPAADPTDPTGDELRAVRSSLDRYQEVFDSH
jgi:L-asparaginase/Glu-tRNA(Gln) amidotransferase subunit D